MASHENEKIYLDVCTLCRPFDDQSAMRIRLETDAYYLIIQAIHDGELQLVTSPVHQKEIEATNDPQERFEVLSLLDSHGSAVKATSSHVRARADELYNLGFGAADAAHVAFAEHGADYFVTCDDKLLKKCKRELPELRARNPVEFCLEKDLK